MEDVKTRLEECSGTALKAYDVWQDKKQAEHREELQEAIHELRKVASRVEIEIAMSERQAGTNKQIPIPSHRSNSKSKEAVESILPDNGNTEAKAPSKGRPQRGRRPAPKK